MPKNTNRDIADAVANMELNSFHAQKAVHGIEKNIPRYNISYTQKLKGHNRRDPGNPCDKYFTDALVKYEVLRDDSWKEIPNGIKHYPPVIVKNYEEEELIIEIEIL